MTTFEDKLRNKNQMCSQKRETLRIQDVLTARKGVWNSKAAECEKMLKLLLHNMSKK